MLVAFACYPSSGLSFLSLGLLAGFFRGLSRFRFGVPLVAISVSLTLTWLMSPNKSTWTGLSPRRKQTLPSRTRGRSTKAAELLGFRVYQVPFVGNRAVDVIGDKSAGVRMAFRICEKGASDFAAVSAGLL
jgi:hypothetical protein